MVDYKQLPGLSEKEEGDGIPAPVQAAPLQDAALRRHKRFFAFVKYLAAFSVVYVCLVYWGREFKAEADAEASVWLSNPFAFFPYRHGKGHKILNGKPAEELFL